MIQRSRFDSWLRTSYAISLLALVGWTFIYGYGVPLWLDAPWEAAKAFSTGKRVSPIGPVEERIYPSGTPMVQRSQPYRIGIEPDGGVSKLGARGLGLGWWQYYRVNGVLREDSREQAGAFVRRAVLNPKASDEAAGIVVYDIPALPDRGLSHWRILEAKLAPIIGARKANILVNSLGDYATYGKNDARLTITTTGATTNVSVQTTDPITGSSKSTSSTFPGAGYGPAGQSLDIVGGKLRFASGGTAGP